MNDFTSNGTSKQGRKGNPSTWCPSTGESEEDTTSFKTQRRGVSQCVISTQPRRLDLFGQVSQPEDNEILLFGQPSPKNRRRNPQEIAPKSFQESLQKSPPKSASNESQSNFDPSSDDDPAEEQNRETIGFKPRQKLLDGTSLLARYKGKHAKDWKDVFNPEYWRGYVVRWEHLPDVVLEQIMGHLNIPDKHSMSQVCRNWYRAFHLPRCWRHFILNDRTLTKRKYTRYFGYVYELDHYRMQFCLQKVSPYWHAIHVQPMSTLMNLFNFVTLAAHFSKSRRERIGVEAFRNLHTFEFNFSPDHIQGTGQHHDNVVYGTGGQLLKGVKDLLTELRFLRHLILTNLLLDNAFEATSLLDEAAANCMFSLETLNITNLTRGPVTFLHPGTFFHLRVLYMSPQNLHKDTLRVIAEGCRRLQEMHLVQNQYTQIGMVVAAKYWTEFHRINPAIKVQLVLQGRARTDLIWQERCPVESVVIDSRFKPLTAEAAVLATSLYGNGLRNLIYLGLPRFPQSKKFSERCDSSLLLLVRQCTHLQRLIIREVISTCTLLLIAYYGSRSNLELLIVRANGIKRRFDFPPSPEWSPEFVQWVKACSTTYKACFAEVCQLMGDPSWRPLTDKEFKKLQNYDSVRHMNRINYNA
ncbi:uncharacterized protein LOC111254393 isoform X4 [Varroa destructor]|uniref:F-box domain-containing protein n=1 Tax=Varroa destructor TaxID=109461 RepID=A0A7M7MEN9_VARDE|nr:uncharacterized protein LOC111254393 isoform X4 [Varroa destructor]